VTDLSPLLVSYAYIERGGEKEEGEDKYNI
jgi:hypothetical protein